MDSRNAAARHDHDLEQLFFLNLIIVTAPSAKAKSAPTCGTLCVACRLGIDSGAGGMRGLNGSLSERQLRMEVSCVEMANDCKDEGDSTVHYLQDTWDFFVFNYNVGNDWTQRMQKVTDFNTVEHFWRTMVHTLAPSDIPNGTDLYVFKRGIKPMWEDPMNENGGRWLIQVLPDADVNFYWEELLMLIVGNAWKTDEDSSEICGVVFQPRARGSRISLWTSNWNNKDAQIRIGNRVKEVLNYPESLLYQTVDQQKNLPKGQDLDTSTYKVVNRVEMANDGKGEGDSAVHYLQDTWDFFVFNYNIGTDWTQRMQKVTDFNTVEDFWSTMFHTLAPADIPNGTDLYVFKRGIKPMWEDPMNENGGRWLIQVLPNADVNFYWEELLMLIVGNSWKTEEDSNEICGVVFQPRARGSRISLWTSNWNNKDAQIRIGKRVKEVLNYPESLLYQTVDQQKNLPKGQDLDTSTYKV
ncbi:unnamed protein product [Rodentolepis nana]|uniref:EIF-4F 25 kDa subunit n=1 Tax=Rodentolepis nana TaxID=102285 RepID=A0A158QI57_RODNA|nr:unnamed protein product [Rodentolepis nana]